MADTYGKYANRPIIFNVSDFQSKIDGITAVDWKTLSTHPQVVGGYCKIGEVDGVANAMTLESDKWMDLSFDSNFNDLYNNKFWIGAWIGFDPGWFTNRGWSTGGVDAMFVGKTDDEIATNLFNEPHIYLYVRKIKNGSGRVFTPTKIKSLSEKPIDSIIIEYTKYWLLNSNAIFDMHSGKALETLIKGLNWLMSKGYIKSKPILIKTNQWFLSNYTPIYGQAVADINYTVCSNNFWGGTGPVNVDFQGLIDKMMTIPDSYHPNYIGKPNILNISEGYFTLPEISVGTFGLNVYNGTFAQMESFYPDWTTRKSSTIPPPPIDPPPPPITQKYFIPTIADLNMRSSPSVAIITNKVGKAIIGGSNIVLEEKDVEGYHWIKTNAWMATDGFGNIVEK